jgi:hypothetical protein
MNIKRFGWRLIRSSARQPTTQTFTERLSLDRKETHIWKQELFYAAFKITFNTLSYFLDCLKQEFPKLRDKTLSSSLQIAVFIAQDRCFQMVLTICTSSVFRNSCIRSSFQQRLKTQVLCHQKSPLTERKTACPFFTDSSILKEGVP